MKKSKKLSLIENDKLFHQMIEEVKDFAIISLNLSGDIVTWNIFTVAPSI